MKPAALSLGPHLQAFFTEHLTHHKRVSPQTLASVRDSFRLLLEFLRTRTGIEPVKRQEKKLITALTREEMDALLAIPDRRTWTGRRDYALLLTMYNTGARVSEMTGLQTQQVRFGAKTYIELHGKGRKERTVPLWSHTARVLESWFEELPTTWGAIAFPNARGHQMARDGVEYLLRQMVKKAASLCSSLASKRVTPHTVRHYVPFRTMSGPLAALQ